MPTDPFSHAAQHFPQTLTSAIRELLETKHLYQSVVVEMLPLPSRPAGFGEAVHARHLIFNECIHGTWLPIDQTDANAKTALSARAVLFLIPHVKMFCRECGRLEPFNPTVSAEVSGHVYSAAERSPWDPTQVFAWAFVCQSCKGPPEVVLVRRDGMKLTLCGRAPIEHVEVPKVMPKSLSQYYSGAIVAHQSGQTLAGLFMLRTCIEQWVRYGSPEGELTETSMARYQDGLPLDFKQRFPSLPKIYTDISGALHAARADAELFESSREKIVEHFDARRLFRLPADPATSIVTGS